MTTTRTITGADYWASYFVNGDASGLTDEERALADAWLARELETDESIVDISRDESGEAHESRFTWFYELHTGLPFSGGSVVDYVAIKS